MMRPACFEQKDGGWEMKGLIFLVLGLNRNWYGEFMHYASNRSM